MIRWPRRSHRLATHGGRSKTGGRQSREMYFVDVPVHCRDANRPGLYREYPPDFFDLIIIDECHRGSARRQQLARDSRLLPPRDQLGMTATPRRQKNADTYNYFGDPIYTYSLRQGIDDGFLAPYRVHRIVTTWDAAGWRPSQGDIDRYGREIPDEEYQTNDFERECPCAPERTGSRQALTDYLRRERIGLQRPSCFVSIRNMPMRCGGNSII